MKSKNYYIQKNSLSINLDRVHPGIRKKHSRAYEKWEDEEDKKLKYLLNKGLSVNELSSYFQRQPNAIRSKIRKLDLKALSCINKKKPIIPIKKGLSKEIKILSKYKIFNLFHFTHIDNLDSIFKNGLLSENELKIKK